MAATTVLPPGVWVDDSDHDDPVLRHSDGTIVDTWREDYPYSERLQRAEYEHVKRLLQIELLKLQHWNKEALASQVMCEAVRDRWPRFPRQRCSRWAAGPRPRRAASLAPPGPDTRLAACPG